MLAGDFEQAWRTSDRIRASGVADPHRYWLGEPFAGKRVMVRCLHGFGDSVQFLRYLPQLRAVAASVCVQVAPEFVELAQCLDGVDEVVTWEQAEFAWDVQMEVTELPYVLRTQVSELPVATNYLRLPVRSAQKPQQKLRVGLAWTAGAWKPSRSIPLETLQPLLCVRGCSFWNLLREPAPQQTEGVLLEDARCRESPLGLAERIQQLDLVVTVDTLAAHVAGAMGVPAWVLLEYEADWRWQRTRDDSPWYPLLRLFRQRCAGDWTEVAARTADALDALASARTEAGSR